MTPEMWRDRKFFLLYDNARPHIAVIIQQLLAKKGVAQLSHPSIFARFNPPPNYFAFPKLKLGLKGDRYVSIEESVTAKLRVPNF